MDKRSTHRHKPAYSGPCGKIRAALECLSVGDSITLRPDQFGAESNKQLLSWYCGSVSPMRKRGVMFTTLQLADGRYVRRTA
jgi:hypothetical protein